MTSLRPVIRCGWLLQAVVFLGVSSASSQEPPQTEDKPLPKLIDMAIPTAEELLRGQPFDWVVLKTLEVMVVEPLEHRPNTLAHRQAEYERVLKIPLSELDLEAKKQQLYELLRLPVTVLDGGEEPEGLIETRWIEKIMFFEDLILERISLLLDQQETTQAFELLMYLDRRHRGWPKYQEKYQRFLFVDGEVQLKAGHLEQALVTFESLYGRARNYPGVAERVGRVTDALMAAAVEADDYRRARHFLARLSSRDAEHSVAVRWREELQRRASELVQQARQAASTDPAEATRIVDRAARVWPETVGLKDAHREITERYPIMRVGVLQLPGEPSPSPDSEPADVRRRQLCEIPLFEPHTLRDGRVRYRSAFFETWEPDDLGRQIRFFLRSRRAAWESRPQLTAGEMVDELRMRIDPAHGDPRWLADVTALSVESPTEWTLTLRRIPLRLEPMLRMPIPLQAENRVRHTEMRPSVWASNGLEQRFVLEERTADTAIYRRSRITNATPGPYLAEIVERRYPNWDAILQGLLRGEIDMVPQPAWKDLRGLQADNRFFVQPTELPDTHLIQLNPRSVPVQIPTLRRALLHALPMEDLLRDVVLHGADQQFGRTAAGPFAKSLSATSSLLKPAVYDPYLAASLVAITRKELKGEMPPLRLRVPHDAVVQRVVPELLQAWKRVGVVVEVQTDQTADAEWDLCYRILRIAEPVQELWPLLSLSDRADVDTLNAYPHWLREQLLELEQTVDWPAAQRILQRIQADFLTEARWLPLWELDDFTVFRRRFAGLPQRPMHTYDQIERWTMQSWFPTETP